MPNVFDNLIPNDNAHPPKIEDQYYKSWISRDRANPLAIYAYAHYLHKKNLKTEAIYWFSEAKKLGHQPSGRRVQEIIRDKVKAARKEERQGQITRSFKWLIFIIFLFMSAVFIKVWFDHIEKTRLGRLSNVQLPFSTNYSRSAAPTADPTASITSRSISNLNRVQLSSVRSDQTSLSLNLEQSVFRQAYLYTSQNESGSTWPLELQSYPNNVWSTPAIPESTTLGDLFLSTPLSLVLYPNTHELVLIYGSEIIEIYPVAIGADGMPFTESFISDRVVMPNGGNGVFGTRGLVLQNNIAIHGTNDPLSIGTSVTKGCIRMHNDDIEKLYPYIAKGTPFRVAEGTPILPEGSAAISGNPPGLPPLSISEERLAQESSNVIYNWRN